VSGRLRVKERPINNNIVCWSEECEPSLVASCLESPVAGGVASSRVRCKTIVCTGHTRGYIISRERPDNPVVAKAFHPSLGSR
jgi:hypothetical protein